jgi:hypothetical protein
MKNPTRPIVRFARRNAPYFRPLAQGVFVSLAAVSAPFIGFELGNALPHANWAQCFLAATSAVSTWVGLFLVAFALIPHWPTADEVFQARGRSICARMRKAADESHATSEGLGSVVERLK